MPPTIASRSRWFVWAVVLGALTLILIVMGAALTSSVTDASPTGNPMFRSGHRDLAFLVAGMALVGLAGTAKAKPVVRGLAYSAVGVVAVQAVLGLASARPSSPGIRIAHAYIAPVFLSILMALAAMGAKAWNCDPEYVSDYGWPSMRSLGVTAPILVFLQIMMGAAFRHQAMGVMPHIVGAMLVALFLMIVGAFAMQQFPTHRTLRPTAVAMMSITGAQVLLGMTAFIMRMMNDTVSATLIVSTVAHVAVGALTLAASVVLMVEIRRNVTPKEAQR